MKYDYINDDNTDMLKVFKGGYQRHDCITIHTWHMGEMFYEGGNIYRDKNDDLWYGVVVAGEPYVIPFVW